MATLAPTEPPVAKRARLAAGTACDLCRRRKQRCDGKRPACSNCLSRDTGAWCQYRSESDQTAAPSPAPAGRLTASLPATQHAPTELAEPVSTGGQSPDDQAFYGDSSTISFVSKLHAADSQERCLPGRSRRPSSLHGRRSEVCVPGLSLSDEPSSTSQPDAPPLELADLLVDAYFERVHIFYPCLHEPSFRAEWEAHRNTYGSLNASEDDKSWLAILNMALAHGTQFVASHASPQDQKFLDADNFALNARRLATTALSKVTTLETVQALLLLSHYLQGTTELNDCWNVGGVLIRTAMSIGLHIDPTGSSLSEIEKQVRKRVWAGCFIVDRTLSMKYGRPSAIPIAIVQRVEKPAAVDDQYITSSTNRARQPQNRPSKMDFFVCTIDQAYIIDAVLNDLYLDDSRLQILKDHAGYPRTELLSRLLGKVVCLEGRLQAWWEGLPRHLREEPGEADGVDFVRQRCVMSLRFHYVRLLVHRQAFVVWSRFNIQSQFLRDIALSSSRSCVAVACQTIREIRENVDRQKLGSLWYILHYTFTAVGILLHIGTSSMDAGVLAGSSADLSELRAWALAFLDRWSSSSALAAQYSSLLRHAERRLADKNNSGSTDSCDVVEAGKSSNDPFDSMTALPDVDSTFLWTSNVDNADLEAWGWDSGLWNIDYRALGQGL